MAATGPVPSARELILELVELQDRIDEVRAAEPDADGAGTPEPTEPTGSTQPPELVELVEREEQVIAELRDYRETQLTFPEPPPPAWARAGARGSAWGGGSAHRSRRAPSARGP